MVVGRPTTLVVACLYAPPDLCSIRKKEERIVGTFLIVVIVVFSLAALVAVQIAASAQEDVVTPLDEAEVSRLFRKSFIGPIHAIEVRDDTTIAVRPKLKKSAPTLSMSTTSTAGGTEVSVWMSEWTTWFGVRVHALWALRKKKMFLRRLPKTVVPTENSQD